MSEALSRPFEPGTTYPQTLWGFGGLHGGLALALATDAMARDLSSSDGDAPVPTLRRVSGHFLRPIRSSVDISTDTIRHGRSATVARAELRSGGHPAVTATATFGQSAVAVEPLAPPKPDVSSIEASEPLQIPAGFVPFTDHVEIRAATPSRPYGGGASAELTAWIRLIDDDTPIDLARLIVMVDALAPSYAAQLTDVLVAPTVELAVTSGDGLASTTSPWVLVEARTPGLSADGWIDERIEAWAPDGTHLGSAQQLRLLATL